MTNITTPLVSIIIPTYKRSDMLSNAIKSVLDQTYSNIEIIVVDDNDPTSEHRIMTENTMKAFESNKNVNYIRHEKNKNGSAARNTGIKNSNGKYIAFLDDDDEFMPNKISLQVNRLEELDDKWGICYTKFERRKKGKLIDVGIEDREGELSTEILKGTFFISAGSNILLKRELVEKVGGFNEQFLRRQDLEFLVRVSSISKIAHIPKTCLMINKDDRSNELTPEKLIKNTEDFLKSFSQYISQVPKSEQKKIVISQNLNLLRLYLLNFDIKSTFNICKDQSISLIVLLRYIYYLFKRRIFKQCYGFKL